MSDWTRQRKRSTSSGMGDTSAVQDPVARELIQQLQESVYAAGLKTDHGESALTPAQDNTISNMRKKIEALESRVKTLETAGRQKVLVMNGGPGGELFSSHYLGRDDVSFPPYSVVEIVGRYDDALLVTMPTEDNLPSWKLAFIAEGGLGNGENRSVGMAYPAVSGINTALVKSNLDPSPPIMGRLGTRKNSSLLYYGVIDRLIGGDAYYSEVGSGFVCLSHQKDTNDFGDLYDVVFEFLQSPGIHLGGYENQYSVLPPIPKHGIREAIIIESFESDDIAQIWRSVAGMPEYTPTQLLSDSNGVPDDVENPWGDAGGA